MPFDDAKYYARATNGDVAGVAIKVSLIAYSTLAALEKIRDGKPIDEELAKIRKMSNDLGEVFDTLTGYTSV